jgi:hypothetical protein
MAARGVEWRENDITVPVEVGVAILPDRTHR